MGVDCLCNESAIECNTLDSDICIQKLVLSIVLHNNPKGGHVYKICTILIEAVKELSFYNIRTYTKLYFIAMALDQ